MDKPHLEKRGQDLENYERRSIDRGVKRVAGVTGWSRRARERVSLSNNNGRHLMLNFFCLAIMVRTSSGSSFQSADPATDGREAPERVTNG